MATVAAVPPSTARTTFRIDVKSFLSALESVSGVAPRKSPKEVLKNVLLHVHPQDGTTLEATDLELGVRTRVLGVAADAPVRVVLPPERFRQILLSAVGKFEVLDVTLETSESSRAAVVSAPGARAFRFDVPLENPDDYPATPEFPDDRPGCDVAPGDLRKLIRRTSFATDATSLKYTLGGCLIEVRPDGRSLLMAATDGRRLAQQVVPGNAEPESFPKSARPVVPLKALKLIERMVPEEGSSARLVLGYPEGRTVPNALHVRYETGTVYTRLLEGTFPRYAGALPTGPSPSEARVVVSELLWGFDAAAVMTSELSNAVEIVWGPDRANLSTRAADVGRSGVEIEVREYAGPAVEIAFDHRFLADALRTLDATELIDVGLTDDKSSALLTSADGFLYVVQPVTVETAAPAPPPAKAG